MLNRQQLAELLQSVNVREVADLSGISEKTIYRLRHQANSPNLETIERLQAACFAWRSKQPKRAPARMKAEA